MTTNALLLASKSSDSNPIAEAIALTGRSLRIVSDSRCAFELLKAGLDNIDLVIIDLDPGIHSISVLEALGCCDTCPPIIVVTGLEELEMTPIARRHGAVACVGKPFSATELASRIEQVCPTPARPCAKSCDLWGHPRECTHECRPTGWNQESRSLARV